MGDGQSSGIAHDDTKAAWDALFTGPLAGWRITKVIVSHYHPDHIGLGGWLCERFGVQLLTSQTCYLGCIIILLDPGALEAQHYREFYRQHGMSDETAKLVSTQGHAYLHMVMPVPLTFRRLVAGDVLVLGRRRFDVHSGDGHAPEQIMLYSAEDRVLLAADQVIAKISPNPNISVWAVEPDGDPLGPYLGSLAALERELPENTFVLPGHQLPFRGRHERCRDPADYHRKRCGLIAEACQTAQKSIAVPLLFPRELDPHQFSCASSEAHAHVN